MGKISMKTAQEVADQVVKPIQDKIAELNKEIKTLLTGYYRETLPPDVMKLWNKHCTYIYNRSSVYPRGVGITKGNSVSIENSPGMSNYTHDLSLSPEQAAEYLKLADKKDDLQEKLRYTQKEIEATILALGTTKRVIESLPELATYFPDSEKSSTQLIIQIAPVREKIKCLISDDKEKECIQKL